MYRLPGQRRSSSVLFTVHTTHLTLAYITEYNSLPLLAAIEPLYYLSRSFGKRKNDRSEHLRPEFVQFIAAQKLLLLILDASLLVVQHNS